MTCLAGWGLPAAPAAQVHVFLDVARAGALASSSAISKGLMLAAVQALLQDCQHVCPVDGTNLATCCCLLESCQTAACCSLLEPC